MTEEQFLTLCRSKYQEINRLNELNDPRDFYRYEKQFDEIMTDLSRKLLESNISEVPADRRKKKRSAGMGK